MVGVRIGLGRRRRPVFTPPVVTDPGVTAIRSDGWSVEFTSPPTMNPAGAPRYVGLSRQGFTSAAAPAMISESLILTQRVRRPYPNQASLDASRVALSDYVYATDTVLGGATNGSAVACPKPVAAWVLADRRMVGGTLRLELVAAHRDARDGEQVACVVFTVPDGPASVSMLVSSSSILAHPADQNAVVGYAADLDISSLADGVVTANAKVYPWLGDASSVADSAANAAGSRAFCPQVFVKNPAKVASPPLAYVSVSGVDASVDANGVASGATKVSTDPAVASAQPFATVGSAIQALKAASNVTGGFTDGCRIRLMAGSNAPGSTSNQTYSAACELVIEADPVAAPGSALLALTTNINMQQAWLRLKDVGLSRSGTAWQLAGKSGAGITFENVAYANGGLNGSILAAQAIGRIEGMAFSSTGTLSIPFSATTAQQWRLIRGLTANGAGVDNFCVVGCNLGNPSVATASSFSDSGAFIGFNRLMNYTGSGGVISLAGGGPLASNVAIIQNVVEWSGTGNNPALRLSADAGALSLSHVVVHHNTFAGYWNYGRATIFYNETNGTLRTHDLVSSKGNIHVSLNTKHDIFFAVNSGDPDGTASARVGGWAYMYGVGCAGECVQYADATSQPNGTGSSFSQAFAGLDAVCGSSTTAPLDPKFVDPKAAVWSGSGTLAAAGTGGGDYRLQTGSPAAGRLGRPVLRFDLDGRARPSVHDASGAYRE